jgi:hypothetical protein
MTSRERVEKALAHQEPDKVPFDVGGTPVTGMHVSSVYALRQSLGLDPPGTPVKVVDPFQMLGEIKPDLIDALNIDVLGLSWVFNVFGFKNEGWKPWTTFDGVPVFVPELFNTEPEPNGDILMYPQGDKTAAPCAKMPYGGHYFDAIVRQPPIDESELKVEDNLEEFGPISEKEIEHYRREIEYLYKNTDKAICTAFAGLALGDIALVPAMWMKDPKGIRDIEEWYVSLYTRRKLIKEIFDRQSLLAVENLERIHQAIGDKLTAVFVTGTDFGMQQGPFIAPELYREIFQPFHKRLNGWIHEHTAWKTFIHSCGSVWKLIPDFIESGFDILNPVQTSAADMNPEELKKEFGDRIVFWGGGIDTQRTLPFGTPEEVEKEAKDRIQIFGRKGGFVFSAVHNIQSKVPVENLRTLFKTVKEQRAYPL